MTEEDFITNVQKLSTPDDFDKNKDELTKVEPHLQEAYLGCLKLGAGIKPAIEAVKVIEKISIESTIAPIDCIRLSGRFRHLHGLIDMKDFYES